MRLMIEYSSNDFKETLKWFPDLKYCQNDNKITGHIIIHPCHYVKKENSIDQWEIKPCETNENECVTGEYLIEIDFNNHPLGWPKVYEIGEKIERLAKKLNKKVQDLHLYPNDKSCCLELIPLKRTASLKDFIIYRVYPYFVWQAYYEKYRKIPPCGEYSHGKKGIEEAIEDSKKYITSLKKIGKNEKCPSNGQKSMQK